MSQKSILENISLPKDLKILSLAQLSILSDELRSELISSVSKTGGHLGAGLGVIELTIALHYIFNAPKDKIIWDVGHQAYPHKLITGRFEDFDSLRQKSGVAGYLKRSESQALKESQLDQYSIFFLFFSNQDLVVLLA